MIPRFFRSRRQFLTVLLTALVAGGAARAEETPRLDDIARLLAGLPGRSGSAYLDMETREVWKQYASDFSESWKVTAGRFPKMREFQAAQLNAAAVRQGAMFYPFGGPDVMNALLMFPDNPTSILVGLEPVGTLPDYETVHARMNQMLAGMRESLYSLMHRSFFITREMDSSLRGQLFDGVLPALVVQLARMDQELLGMSMVSVVDGGRLAPWDRNAPGARTVRNRGVEILFRKPGTTRVQRLYYFSVDLGPRLERNLPFQEYLTLQAPLATFFKSTSYFPHDEKFGFLNRKVLELSHTVLQDDSGIPYRFFTEDHWQVELYGAYEKPYGSFHFRVQPDLRRAYTTPGVAKPLEFRIGYGFGKVPSNLLLARRKPQAGTGAAK
jgi:hypothetical protein